MTARELFLKIAPRLGKIEPTMAFIDAVNLAIESVCWILTEQNSPLLLQKYSGTLLAGEDTLTLPDTFISLAEKPLLENGSRLEPMNPDRRNAGGGQPAFYEMGPGVMTVTPAATADTPFTLFLLLRPDPLQSLDGLLPFNGLFDLLIGELAAVISEKGFTITGDANFIATARSLVSRPTLDRTANRIELHPLI